MVADAEIVRLISELPAAGEYQGEPVFIADNLWRQYHRPSERWHRFKLGIGRQRQYFLANEARWLRSLNGLPLATCHQLDDIGKCRLLVTDYLPGQTLAMRVRQQGVRFAGYDRVIQQLYDALTLCHRQGCVHGDIKPNNIIVDDGSLVLIDFANASALGSRVSAHAYRAYSPSYSLPNQQRGFGRTSPLTDWYGYLMVLRIVLGGGLGQPNWQAARPVRDCFGHWMRHSGLSEDRLLTLDQVLEELDESVSIAGQF
ncbi:MAG: phosphotransferase [Halopseudomonas sp.]